jgi:hypothetical protein
LGQYFSKKKKLDHHFFRNLESNFFGKKLAPIFFKETVFNIFLEVSSVARGQGWQAALGQWCG